MHQVTENVFVETGFRGCNPGFLVTPEGLVLIDTPFRPTDAVGYKKMLEKYGPVKYLINTEPHFDHISSNFLFDATRVAHQGTRERMADKEFAKRGREQLIMVDPEYVQQLDNYRLPLPEITFTGAMVLYVGAQTIKLMHLPGHTASETAVFIPEEKAVFTGDNIFHHTHTFMHEALPKAWLDSLERLKALDAEFYIPGHGEVCGKDYLEVQASIIKEWIDAGRDAVKRGWSLEEAQARISFLDRYPMDDEMKIRARELERMGIANVYGLATKGL